MKTLDFRDLKIWKRQLPDVKFAVLPSSNNRPNPLAVEDRLYASVFAPGAICSLERDKGKLIWRRSLHKYSGAAVSLHQQSLLTHTPTTVFALKPESGETRWSFCPYGDKGEVIYSSPTGFKDYVYVGDRPGYLHCLDANDGKTVWKKLTNRAENSNVNSTPVIVNNLVLVTTNASTIVAYESASGKLAWKRELDGPSTYGPVLHGELVLAVSDSLYAFNPRTGGLRRRLSWKGRKVQQADSTGKGITVMFWPETPKTKLPPDKREAEKIAAKEEPSVTLAFVAKSGKRHLQNVAAFCPSFRYERNTGFIYLSHLHGVDVIHATTGAIAYHLTTDEGNGNGLGLVDVKDRIMYVLNGDGIVWALRHP
jgi:outer membrane protein assembly factor BamB